MKQKISKLENILLITNKKVLLISIIILFITTLFLSFMYFPDLNFFLVLKTIITNPVYITSLILSILIITISIYEDNNNYFIILRNKNYNVFLEKNFKIIKIYIFFLITLSIILASIFAIIRCKMNFLIIHDNIYSLPIIIYLIFYIARLYILIYLLIKLVYLLQTLFHKIGGVILSFFLVFLNFTYSSTNIKEILQIPILITDYFKEIKYSNYYLEISGSILQIIIFIILINIANYFIERKMNYEI